MVKYPYYENWKNNIEGDKAGNFLVMNIATSGLPTKDKNAYKDPTDLEAYSGSRIVQIIWGVYDNEQNEIVRKNYVITPNGFNINNSAAKIHGITQQKAITEGKNIVTVFDELVKDIGECKYIVSHNAEFDYNILMSELHRNNCKDLSYIIRCLDRICTGEATKSLLKVKTAYGNSYKMPKLTELYKWCFKKDIGVYDVNNNHMALVKIFFHLKTKYKMVQKD